MTPNLGTAIIVLLVFLAFGITLFMALRQAVLWYFRINQVADDIAYIAYYFRQKEASERKPQQSNQRQPLPPLPPREEMTLEERARRMREANQ